MKREYKNQRGVISLEMVLVAVLIVIGGTVVLTTMNSGNQQAASTVSNFVKSEAAKVGN